MDTSFIVLLADDDVDDQYFIKHAFTMHDCNIKIFTVSDGTELLDFLAGKSNNVNSSKIIPDVLLLDINMPKMDGIEALKFIRKNVKFKDMPVYILSTTRNEEQINRAKNLSVKAFYSKPNDLAGYKPLVEEICNLIKSNS